MKTNPVNWWPRSIPLEYVPTLRALGRRNLRFSNFKRQVGDVLSRYLTWKGQLTLAEHRLLNTMPPHGLFGLASVLGEGVKLFKLPADLFESLQEIEIPLRVKDYTQPFPAVIVELPGQRFHMVVSQGDALVVGEFQPNRTYDALHCLDCDRTIEDYLRNARLFDWTKGGVIVDEKEVGFHRNDFRATLNFLLLCTMDGVLSGGRVALPRPIRKDRNRKITNPEIFRPQSITLFRQRVISANGVTGSGSGKTPHWRRQHWRRVAYGVGRTERRLCLIPRCFVNIQRFSGDVAGTEYFASVSA